MSTHTIQADLAELLKSLGVPKNRIRQTPTPGTATEEDLLENNARRDGPQCELVDGVLVEKPVGHYESSLAFLIGHQIQSYQQRNQLGFIVAADGPTRPFPGTVREPDLSFFLWNRFPGRKKPSDQVLGMAPDLAVEVLSPSNRRAEMIRKRREYFKAGTQCVWMLDPRKRTLKVYLNQTEFTEYGENQVVKGSPVLPGFSLSLHELFELAGDRC